MRKSEVVDLLNRVARLETKNLYTSGLYRLEVDDTRLSIYWYNGTSLNPWQQREERHIPFTAIGQRASIDFKGWLSAICGCGVAQEILDIDPTKQLTIF